MTSKAEGSVAYLMVDYGRVSFLIRRDFWEGSRYAPQAQLPVFDLEERLTSLFGLGTSTPFPLVLVASTSGWSPQTRLAWGEPVPPMVGFRVSREPRVVVLDPADRTEVPALGAFFGPWGILGCRFPSESAISFFLDPETLVRRSLEQEALDARPVG